MTTVCNVSHNSASLAKQCRGKERERRFSKKGMYSLGLFGERERESHHIVCIVLLSSHHFTITAIYHPALEVIRSKLSCLCHQIQRYTDDCHIEFEDTQSIASSKVQSIVFSNSKTQSIVTSIVLFTILVIHHNCFAVSLPPAKITARGWNIGDIWLAKRVMVVKLPKYITTKLV